MEQGRLTTPRVVKALLARHNLQARKRYGQNFLIDANILAKIVQAAELTKEDNVLEVGPGIGALTQSLAEAAGQVIAVELDRRLLPVLEESLAAYSNVTVVEGDILRLDLSSVLGTLASFKVVANLPYYITSPVLALFLESGLSWDRLVIMVQAEVAARLVATPGGKDYGPLTILVQFHAVPEIVAKVSPGSFLPAPEVESAVVRLRRRGSPAAEVPNERDFFRLVRSSFAQRRKTLGNSLTGAGYPKAAVEAALAGLAIDPRRRAETLSIAEFAALAKEMDKHRSGDDPCC